MIKKFAAVFIILLVIAVVWTGIAIYEVKIISSVNPQVATFVLPISQSFNTKGFDKVNDLKSNLNVTPEDMQQIENEL